MMIKTDLEKVNPAGRVDVLAYRGVEKLAKHLESQHGLEGIWDILKPSINKAIGNSGLGSLDIGVEGKILLALLQAKTKQL
jgi:hypothetical protein